MEVKLNTMSKLSKEVCRECDAHEVVRRRRDRKARSFCRAGLGCLGKKSSFIYSMWDISRPIKLVLSTTPK